MSEYRGTFTHAAAQAYLAAEPEIHTDRLSERIWTASDGHCRAVFVEGDSGVIAFDTFGTPGGARAYKKAIATAVPGKAIRNVIYTHDHLDHAGFAAALAPDAEIIADEICAKIIKLRRADGQRLPTRVLSGTRNAVQIDGVALTLLNPGPTHGSGNISAWFAEEKILYSSDTVLANARYGFLPDYHLGNFVRCMRGFLELDWQTFVPGRFELTDRAGFARGCDYLEAMQTECQKAFAEFVPIWVYDAMYGYVSNKLKDRFGDLDGFDQHVGQTAIRVVHHYLMGGWGLEDTPEAAVLLADQVAL
jgi:glyoxylase-like metal-dependent hydrolase (beta-lactamase superfamily II)